MKITQTPPKCSELKIKSWSNECDLQFNFIFSIHWISYLPYYGLQYNFIYIQNAILFHPNIKVFCQKHNVMFWKQKYSCLGGKVLHFRKKSYIVNRKYKMPHCRSDQSNYINRLLRINVSYRDDCRHKRIHMKWNSIHNGLILVQPSTGNINRILL